MFKHKIRIFLLFVIKINQTGNIYNIFCYNKYLFLYDHQHRQRE